MKVYVNTINDPSHDSLHMYMHRMFIVVEWVEVGGGVVKYLVVLGALLSLK